MHLVFCILLMVIFGYPVAAQEEWYETGILMLESTFDDFDPGPLNSGGIPFAEVFADIPDNDTPALEMELDGGTENAWNEQLSTTWETPENSETVTWRFQYRIRVVDAPYDHQVRLQINQEPWSGFSVTHTIPEGFEEKWLFYDFLEGPFANFDYEVLNFSLRFGAQQQQTMWLDDIRVYQSNALLLASFETRVDDRLVNGFGIDAQRADEENAPEGFQVLKTNVTEPGSSVGDASIILSRVINTSNYDGALRMTCTMRTASAPVEIRAGMADSNDLQGQAVFAQETVTLTEEDTWQVVSFLIQPLPFADSRFWFPFIQFGGQGNAEVDLDRLALLRTDEEVENPVSITNWSLF